MKLCEESQTDYEGGETQESFLNVNEPIEPAAKTAESVQPGIGALDRSTGFSKTAAVFGFAFGYHRRDS